MMPLISYFHYCLLSHYYFSLYWYIGLLRHIFSYCHCHWFVIIYHWLSLIYYFWRHAICADAYAAIILINISCRQPRRADAIIFLWLHYASHDAARYYAFYCHFIIFWYYAVICHAAIISGLIAAAEFLMLSPPFCLIALYADMRRFRADAAIAFQFWCRHDAIAAASAIFCWCFYYFHAAIYWAMLAAVFLSIFYVYLIARASHAMPVAMIAAACCAMACICIYAFLRQLSGLPLFASFAASIIWFSLSFWWRFDYILIFSFSWFILMFHIDTLRFFILQMRHYIINIHADYLLILLTHHADVATLIDILIAII